MNNVQRSETVHILDTRKCAKAVQNSVRSKLKIGEGA